LKAFNLFEHKSIGQFSDWQGREATYTAEIAPYQKVVYDQHDTMTCTCNAAAAAYKYALERQDLREERFVPSRLFLYYVARAMAAEFKDDKYVTSIEEYQAQAKWLGSLPHEGKAPRSDISDDDGSAPASVCQILCFLGACDERPVTNSTAPVDTWPFYEQGSTDVKLWGNVVNDWTSVTVSDKKDEDGNELLQFKNLSSLGVKAPPPGAFRTAPRHRTLDCASPPLKDNTNSVDSWKQCLENGYPIIVTFQMYNEYGDAADGLNPDPDPETKYILAMPSAESKWEGSHVVLIVGYDDTKARKGDAGGCFMVQDSYGIEQKWNDQGFWWLPYKAMTTLVQVQEDPTKRGMMLSDPWILESPYYNF